MPTTTPTRPTMPPQRTALQEMATEFIEQNVGQPFDHGQHTGSLTDLLEQAYELGRLVEKQAQLDVLDEAIDAIQKSL